MMMSILRICSMLLITVCLSGSIILPTINAQSNALTPEHQATKQWWVQIDESVFDQPSLSKPISGEYDTYSLVIRNQGKTLHDVTVEAFRKDPQSSTQLELFTLPVGTVASGHNVVKHSDFPVSTKAEQIEIVITWREPDGKNQSVAGKGRKYKQSFVFHLKHAAKDTLL